LRLVRLREPGPYVGHRQPPAACARLRPVATGRAFRSAAAARLSVHAGSQSARADVLAGTADADGAVRTAWRIRRGVLRDAAARRPRGVGHLCARITRGWAMGRRGRGSPACREPRAALPTGARTDER